MASNQDSSSTNDNSLTTVSIDGLVVMKIIKHCKDNLPELVTGQLLGLDFDSTLEVTNCFPFPERATEEEDDENAGNVGGAEYQLEMMKCLREVNVDNNTVGWYVCSTYLSASLNVNAIEAQYNYQDRIKKSVMIVYDPLKTSLGTLSLKAYRLTNTFMQVWKDKTFTKESLIKAKVSFKDIFEEIPVVIQNSTLAKCFLFEAEEQKALNVDLSVLNLASNPFLERSLDFLNDGLDDLAQEQNKFQYYQRSLARQQTQQAGWLAKRRNENAARKAQDEPLLPETDPTNPIFKSLAEPSRLDSLLTTAQINGYCEQIHSYATTALTKTFLFNDLEKE
eukprot:TRINITY_DN633_c0_g1_i1.p1 TRINITY_DN633_c0_g1~~TRINITY_DN633_c0_g1_i1.p1  ORF type:complete len:336 (-),score=88.44 TRINITY_DN633_c0_g1_i1:118-1125(-)